MSGEAADPPEARQMKKLSKRRGLALRTIGTLYDCAKCQSMEDEVEQLTRENHQLGSENKRLQGELEKALRERQLSEASISQKKKKKEKLDQLKMQQLDSYNKWLQGEILDSLQERQLSQSKHHEDREASSRLQEEVKKEKDRYSRACKKTSLLRKASADTDDMMQTLKTQNNVITAKFEATEAQLSASRTRQTQLEDALHQEKTQRAVLEERASQTASDLEKERKRSIKLASALMKRRPSSKKYSVELKDEKTPEDWQCLTTDLQEALTNLCQVQEQGNLQLRHALDIELRLEALNELDDFLKSARETCCKKP